MAVNVGAKKQQTTSAKPNTPGSTRIPTFGLTNKLNAQGNGGEQYEKLYETILKTAKELNEDSRNDEKYSVIKLLKTPTGLNYSGIVFVESYNDNHIGHVLIIEKTGNYPEKLIENIAGVRYEIIRTPADGLNEEFIQQTISIVADHLQVDPSLVTIVDGTLVPNEFDVNSESMVNDLLHNTLNAVTSELQTRLNNFSGTNIAEFVNTNPNGKFFVSLYFNPEESILLDQTGMPVRQDVCIALTYKLANRNNNRSIHQGSDTIEIVKTYGYLDFEWSPVVGPGNVIAQKFLPNFVITHIDTDAAPTPDILMMGVASVLSINEELNWIQSFRPTPGKKNEIDFNDIGALNIEGNLENNPSGFGKKYDTKSKVFTIAELNKYIQTLVHPNIVISIDIPKAGPETWFTSILQYIKFRNDARAIARFNTYVNTMTNGAFPIDSNIPLFAGTSNKIHGGFYKAKDGYRDVRHLSSYLSFANFVNDTNQSPALIAQYTNTLYNGSIPADLRIAERKKYIDEMSNNTAVYKQTYDRVTFNAAALVSIVNGMKMAGFNPIHSNMGATNDMFQRRSVSDFAGAILGNDVRIMGTQNSYGNWYGMSHGYNRQY